MHDAAPPFRAEKKPVDVDVVQFDGRNYEAMLEFAGLKNEIHKRGPAIYTRTSEGLLRIDVGHYVVKEPDGSLAVYSPSDFIKSFTVHPDVTDYGECTACGWPLDGHTEGELNKCQEDLLRDQEELVTVA